MTFDNYRVTFSIMERAKCEFQLYVNSWRVSMARKKEEANAKIQIVMSRVFTNVYEHLMQLCF